MSDIEIPIECINCRGDRCENIGIRCNDIPVIDPKLISLFEWKHKMCSKVEIEYDHGAIICRLGDNIINKRGSCDICCKNCPYG